MPRSFYKNTIYQHRRLFHIYKILSTFDSIKKKNEVSYIKRYRSILRRKTFAIFKKSSTIREPFFLRSVQIHDGLFFQRLVIKKAMLFFKFGQFVFTKRMGHYIHKDNKLAKKKAKALKQLVAQTSKKSAKKADSASKKK